ncbi:hypothetical protein D3C80_923150 [compost metagenome]
MFAGQVKHGLFDATGTINILPGIGIMSVEVNQEKQIASHPLEINSYVQDNVVTGPRTIVITLAAEKNNIDQLYNTLDQIYATNNTLLCVMSDAKLYKNMTIQSLPIRRDPSKFDLLEIPLVLHEFIFSVVKVTPMTDPENVELAEYSTRQKAGLQKPVTQSGADAIRVQGQMTIPAGTN